MNLRDILQQEADNLRAQASAVVAAGKAEAERLQGQALSIEQKLTSIPAELEQLAEEAVSRVRDFFKGL